MNRPIVPACCPNNPGIYHECAGSLDTQRQDGTHRQADQYCRYSKSFVIWELQSGYPHPEASRDSPNLNMRSLSTGQTAVVHVDTGDV